MALANLLADNKQDRKTVPPPKLKRLVPQARSRKTEGVPDQTYGMPDRTLLVFDTDACIRLYPYFRAILEFDETEDCEDYEQIGIFVTATVMAELGQMTLRPSRKLKLARSLLQLIQSNVREKNPQIIKQSYAYAHEMRYSQSALVKDKLIREQAKLLQAYGWKVLVVTDDNYQHVKLATMKLSSLDFIKFLTRFHWLTPIVLKNCIDDMRVVGDAVTVLFAETILRVVLWRATMSQLSQLPNREKANILSLSDLTSIMQSILEHKEKLVQRGEPFASLPYERLKTALGHWKEFSADKAGTNDSWGLKTLRHFAYFIYVIVPFCQPIGAFYINTQSQVDLLKALGAMYDYLITTEPEPTVEPGNGGLQINAEPRTKPVLETNSVYGTETGAEPNPGSETNPESETNPQSETNPKSETNPGSGTNHGSGINPGSGTNRGSEINPVSGTNVEFRLNSWRRLNSRSNGGTQAAFALRPRQKQTTMFRSARIYSQVQQKTAE